MEQSAVDECFRGGGWAKRMWMCSEEQRGFERCFLMQSVCSFTAPASLSAHSVYLHVVTLATGFRAERGIIKAGKLTIKDRGLISPRGF